MSLNSVENQVNGSGKTSKGIKRCSWRVLGELTAHTACPRHLNTRGWLKSFGVYSSKETHEQREDSFGLCCSIFLLRPSQHTTDFTKWQIIQITENHHAKWLEKGPKNDRLQLPKYTAHIYQVNTKIPAAGLGENIFFFNVPELINPKKKSIYVISLYLFSSPSFPSPFM